MSFCPDEFTGMQIASPSLKKKQRGIAFLLLTIRAVKGYLRDFLLHKKHANRIFKEVEIYHHSGGEGYHQ